MEMDTTMVMDIIHQIIITVIIMEIITETQDIVQISHTILIYHLMTLIIIPILMVIQDIRIRTVFQELVQDRVKEANRLNTSLPMM